MLLRPATLDDLEIQEGTLASIAFAEMISSETSPERRRKLREDLIAYCRRDTESRVVEARAGLGDEPLLLRVPMRDSKCDRVAFFESSEAARAVDGDEDLTPSDDDECAEVGDEANHPRDRDEVVIIRC